MSLFLSILAGGSTSLYCLLYRKNGELSSTKSPNGYLTILFFCSLILSLLFYPNTLDFQINPIILGIGAIVGFLNALLMLFTSRAIQEGPSGLTFAFQNASAIFPALILFLLLGSDFGYTCSFNQLAGMALVLIGLFSGINNESSSFKPASLKWLKYAFTCFILQVIALTIIQARCLLFDCGEGSRILSDFTLTKQDDIWFMPGQFGTAFLIHFILFLKEKRKPQKKEIIFSCLAGAMNLISTCLLLVSTQLALPFEKGILFPCFAITALLLCNIWANRLYNEKFNLKTNILCPCGILIAVI